MFISNTSKNGPVIDVSMGGLAFQYIERKETREETIKFGTLIGGDFCLRQAPVETVAETRYVEDDTVHCRCGLKFGALSRVEKKKLQQFIASRAVDDTKKNALLNQH